ncbi:MAG: hypothetical protein ICV64_05580 [Thermoleophilia bacterium]|nr:hypothetical protein [Thermoleophilia bacterium]
MIVVGHVAVGALAGALARSRGAAVGLGLVLHGVADWVPHGDTRSRPFEAASGIAGVLALAFARGPLDRTTLGAAASALPDVEHVLPLPRPGGQKLFPTHRFPGWHRAGRVLPVSFQLVAAGAAIGALVAGAWPRGRG